MYVRSAQQSRTRMGNGGIKLMIQMRADGQRYVATEHTRQD